MIITSKIHFNKNAARFGVLAWAECGAWSTNSNHNPNKVTCERCRKTKEFKAALAGIASEEQVES